ncbi:MAG TPA: protein kinase [Thermoanaerobaculia bacterium]|nr:protein kinase [Thermoanaerobaculia bacterium]
MTLTAGFRLGPYEILSPIGAGGMGEVYRARDTRLGRDVAVKVLPASFSNDPDRLRRFEQEARAAGILNHPNVTAVYDIGTVDGSPYVVSELLEGETLRSRLGGGPLAPRRATEYAVQIAHGLSAAHEKGIVHRDLKPENLFVTKDGRVKILDFGLAKLTQPDGGGPQTNFPTAAASAETEPGVVLGTLGYMSPEQVRGRPADARSDIFSFGAILYEMLSGKRAFHRDTAADTMSAILREDPPDLSSTNRLVSPALDRIIRHCLEKDPEARFHSAHDLAFQLQIPPAEDSATLAAAAPARVRLRPVTMAMTALLLLLAGTLAVLLLRHPRGERAAQTVRFSLPIPPGTIYAPGEISRGASISPDGTRIVVEAISNGRRRLFLRPLDSERFSELEGSVGASAHFWSPDGRFIAFFADGKLKKISAAGGPAEELCAAHFDTVGAWSRDGTILFVEIPPFEPGVYRVSDKGGEPVRILGPDSAQPSSALWPQFLPDGRRYLYQGFVFQPPGAPATGRRHELKVASLGAKETRTIAPLDSRFEYAEPGYLVYVRDNALFVQPFDEKRTVLRGEPVLLAEGVRHFFGPGNASFSISQTGVVVYEAAELPLRLAWFDRQGREVGTLGQPAVVEGLRISPEGGRVAVDVLDSKPGTSDLWLYELASGVSTRLNAGAVDEVEPLWSPDGTKLLFRSDEKGPPDVHEMVVGSPGSERPVLEQPGTQQPEDVSPNGRLLVYLNDVATTPDIWLLPLEGDRKPRPWVRSPFNERSPRFSPDGRWIAYESDESGTPEVYVALTDGAGEKKRLSPGGGRQPRWRRDGKELDYIAPDGTIMAIPIALGAALGAGAPARLFHVETGVRNFDLTPDGNRFLVSTPVEKSPESPLRVILDWPSALPKER